MPFLVPTGPFGVGTVPHELVDPGRARHVLADSPGRRMFLKLWYPAERAAEADNEPIWEELRRDARTPAPLRILLKLVNARSASRPNAPFVPPASPPRAIVYNHGLISFAAENTSLMQELASHGCIVVAIQHAEQLAEWQALGRTESADKKKADAELTRRLRKAARAERSTLAVAYYAASTSTSRLVVERAADTSFVLDRLEDVLRAIPGSSGHAIDTTSVDLLGFSVGGAVATHAATRDERVRGVVNLDGGMQGTPNAQTLRQPYLMLYSSANDGMNDELLPPHAERAAPPGTAHLNYHDIAGLLPVLRLLRVTGRTNARAFLERRNALVRAFVSRLSSAR